MKTFLEDLYFKYLEKQKNIVPYEKMLRLYEDLRKEVSANLDVDQKELLEQLLALPIQEAYERKQQIFFDGFYEGLKKGLELVDLIQ